MLCEAVHCGRSEANEITEYIALEKPSAAQKLVKEIFKKTKLLKKFPESGRYPPELQDTNYHETIVDPCRIFYRVEKNKVYILHVMRGERELRKFLLENRENTGN